MPIYVQGRASEALAARCRAIADAFGPRSKIRQGMQTDLATIVKDDHSDMLMRGVDRYGKPRAKLAESTLKNPKRGPGPSLVPRGPASRFATNCEVVWMTFSGVPQLVKRFRDILDKKGRPFAQYHLEGATKPGTKWVLPRRDVGGLSPRGWGRLRERWQKFAADVAHYGKKGS